MRYLLAVALIAVFLVPAMAHGPYAWIGDNNLTNPVTGEGCCGVEDCFPLPAGDIRNMGQGEYRFRLNNHIYRFPTRQVSPSRDGANWACFNQSTGKPRCLFIYFGG